MFTDAESLSVRNFIANYKEECFECLIKKMILLKKNKYRNLFFLVGLSAIYVLKSVLHLKYEKNTVINNMQLLHYIDTVLLFIQDLTPTAGLFRGWRVAGDG